MNIRDIQAEMHSVWDRMQELQDYYKSLMNMERQHHDRVVSGADKALESEGQQAINEEHERRSIT